MKVRRILQLLVPAAIVHNWLKRKRKNPVAIPGDTPLQRTLVSVAPYVVSAILQQRKPKDRRPRKYFVPYGKMREYLKCRYGMMVGNDKVDKGLFGKIRSWMPYGLILWWDAEDLRSVKPAPAKPAPAKPAAGVSSVTSVQFNALKAQVESLRRESTFRADTNEIIALRTALGDRRPSVTLVLTGCCSADDVKRSLTEHLRNSIYEQELLVAYHTADGDVAEVIAEFSRCDSRIRSIDATDKSLAEVRSAAISVATGDYIAFLNVNDRYSNRQMLELFVLTGAVEKARVCCGKVWQKANGKVVYPDGITWERRGFVPAFRPPVAAGLCGAIYDCNWLRETEFVPVRSTVSDDALFLQFSEVLAERVFCLGRTLGIKGGDPVWSVHTQAERDDDVVDALLTLARYTVARSSASMKELLIEEVTSKYVFSLRNLVWGFEAEKFKNKIIELGTLLPECQVEENFIKPLVSVVVPAYNVEKYLKRCLDSLVAQTLRSIEIIVVDDGSSDATPSLADAYAAGHSNISVIHKPNGGLSSARNAGLVVAKGKYVGFVDSDDYVAPQMYKRMSDELEQHLDCTFAKCGVVVQFSYKVDEREQRSAEEYFQINKSGCVELNCDIAESLDVSACDRLYRRDYLLQNGIRYPEGTCNEDEVVFFMDCCRAGKAFILSDKFYHYQRNLNGIMASQMNCALIPDAVTKVYPYIARLLIREDRRDLLGVLYRHICGCSQRFIGSSAKSEIWRCLAKVLQLTDAFFYLDMLPSEHHEWMLNRLAEIKNLDATGVELEQSPEEWFPARLPSKDTSPNPRVSFVVPVYNAERYLAHTLERLRNQTLQEIEIVCINDGSIDRSDRILRQYAALDSRIRVFRQENLGVSAARNLGISQSKGDYIAFVDGDDLPALDMAEVCVRRADAHRLDALCFDYECFDYLTFSTQSHYWCVRNHLADWPEGCVFSLADLQKLPVYGACWNYLWRTAFIRQVGVSFPKIKLGEDLVWVLSLLHRASRLEVMSRVLYRYRRGNPSSAVSRLQTGSDEAPVLALKGLSGILAEINDSKIRKIVLRRMLSDVLFYGERMSNALSWLRENNWMPFGGLAALREVAHGGDASRLETLVEKPLPQNEFGMDTVLQRCPEDIADKMRSIIEARKNQKQDLIIITGQLNSMTNEPIDSWTFFMWLQREGIPSRYVCWCKHQFVPTMKQQNGLKDVILLKENGVDNYELLERCADILPRTRAVVQENVACHSVLRWFFYQLPNLNYVFLQHGVIFWKWASKLASSLSLVNQVNVSSKREKQFLLERVPPFWMSGKPPSYIVAGLPRLEMIKDESDQEPVKVIFVMFTWRATFNDGMEALARSAYLAGIRRLFSVDNVARLKTKNLRVVMAAHHHLANHIENLDFGVPIELVPTSEVSKWIRHASICLTDYSSVSFDFIFQNKPVVFWTPDREDALLCHEDYAETVFAEARSNELFNRVDTPETALERIEYYADRRFALESTNKKIAASFFAYRKDICRHLYRGIIMNDGVS